MEDGILYTHISGVGWGGGGYCRQIVADFRQLNVVCLLLVIIACFACGLLNSYKRQQL